MRRDRKRRFRRGSRRFRFRPAGFSDPIFGPMFRGIFGLTGVPTPMWRSTFNGLAVLILLCFAGSVAFGSAEQGEFGGAVTAFVGVIAVGCVGLVLSRHLR